MPRFALVASAFALLICGSAAPACAQALAPERERALAPADSFRECDDCPEMVVVPAGSFTMGSPSGETGRNSWEGPQRVVTFAQPFAVGKFEVTVDQFAAFVRETGHPAGTRCWTFENGTFGDKPDRSFRNPGYVQDGSHPAVCLSWHDATAYVSWLQKKTGKGYRLLSEAEWEYAARGRTAPGPGPRFPFGEDEKALCGHGNGLDQTAKTTIRGSGSWTFLACSDGHAFTAPVGKFPANAFGLHDMLGNAKEWTQDCFLQGKGYEGAPTDGAAWTSGDCATRVVRGGSWLGYGRQLRVAFRYRNAPGDRVNDIGLRVARMLVGPWPAPAGR
jgi:formylglycine-generating enzyme required for sulfatase activity